MRKKTYKILFIILFIIMNLVFNCNTVHAEYTSTSLNSNKQIMRVGNKLEFKLNYNEAHKNTNTYPTVISSNPSIVSVQNKGGIYEITAEKEGNAEVKVTVRYATRTTLIAIEEINIEITVFGEEEILQDKIDAGNQTVTDMKNAYKTIPGANASADEIDTFVKSDATYNNLNSLKTVSKDTAKIWRDKLDAARIDQITRAMYTETIGTLENYINGNNLDTNKNNLSQQMNAAVSATNTTIEGYEMQLQSIIEGSNRVEGNFTDIFDDISYYEPTDSSEGQQLINKANVILTIITNIGMVIAVLMSAILGIKYMLGSVEEKADYKKGMIPYLVGAFLLFGICTIVKVMQQFGESINNI